MAQMALGKAEKSLILLKMVEMPVRKAKKR
jgi:hypothetical protein